MEGTTVNVRVWVWGKGDVERDHRKVEKGRKGGEMMT